MSCIEKFLRLKVCKYPANVDALTYLNVVRAHRRQQLTHQQLTGQVQRNDVQLRQGVSRHRLHPPQANFSLTSCWPITSSQRTHVILQAHSQASKFRNSEFEVVCEAETTRTEYETTTATSTFKLDTDALYFETMLSGGDQQNTYSRLSRLVEFYYFQTTATSGKASTWPAQEPRCLSLVV